MTWIVHVSRALLGTYYAYMVEYRAELLFWALSNSFPFILMGVWIEAARGGLFGMTPVDFARYFLAAFVVRQLNIVWVIWEFEKEVVEGRLSSQLLQPIDPVWHHVASHISERLARFPFIFVLIALFFALYPQSFWVPDPIAALLAIVAIAVAFCLRFLIQYTFALLAFWTERASAIEQLWFLPYVFLSGMLAPLEVYPPGLREVILWTPFPYMVHFSAALLVGLPVQYGRGMLVMAVWFAVFWVLNRRLWRLGLKRYSGMGA